MSETNALWTILVIVKRASHVPGLLRNTNCKLRKRLFFSAKEVKCLYITVSFNTIKDLYQRKKDEDLAIGTRKTLIK